MALGCSQRQPASSADVVGLAPVVAVQVARAPLERLFGAARVVEALQPQRHLHLVARHAQPVLVHVRQVVHAHGHALLGRRAEQLGGLGVVLEHALAVAVQTCKVVHGPGVALVGGHAEQARSLHDVHGHAAPVVVQRRERVDGCSAALVQRRRL